MASQEGSRVQKVWHCLSESIVGRQVSKPCPRLHSDTTPLSETAQAIHTVGMSGLNLVAVQIPETFRKLGSSRYIIYNMTFTHALFTRYFLF